MSGYQIGLGQDGVVTGEAVTIELPSASLPILVASGLVDVVIALILLWLGSTIAFYVDWTSAALEAAAQTVLVAAVLVGLPTTLETLTRGRSIGKLLFGLRTVRDDAGPIAFRQAFTRALIGVPEIWLTAGVPALISAALTIRSKRLGDFAAGTWTVRERVSMRLPLPTPMPPHLEQWALHADIAALPDSLALAIRQFLGRAATLTPAARALLGNQLLEQTMRYVAPQPPNPVHPEYVLAAVIADRRRRDWDRLQREAALRARVIPPDPMSTSGAGAPTGP